MTYRALIMMASVNMLLLTSYLLILINTGLDEYISTALALLITLSSNILSRYNIALGGVRLDNELKKACVVRLGSDYLIQSLRFKVMSNVSVELNSGGFLIPFTISALILTYIALHQGITALGIVVLLAIISTLLVNRVSVVVRGVGLAVPVVMVSLIDLMLITSVALVFNTTYTLWLLSSYVVSYISVLIGVDIMNLSKVILHNVRRVVIGGLNVYDALSIIPATTTLLTYIVFRFVST